MGAADRIETNRIPCDCGKGEFVFYSCEPDGWSFLNHPDEKWFEMPIFCENCFSLFQAYSPTRFARTGEPSRWKIEIPESNTVPKH
jgi:hypothetical protein